MTQRQNKKKTKILMANIHKQAEQAIYNQVDRLSFAKWIGADFNDFQNAVGLVWWRLIGVYCLCIYFKNNNNYEQHKIWLRRFEDYVDNVYALTPRLPKATHLRHELVTNALEFRQVKNPPLEIWSYIANENLGIDQDSMLPIIRHSLQNLQMFQELFEACDYNVLDNFVDNI